MQISVLSLQSAVVPSLYEFYGKLLGIAANTNGKTLVLQIGRSSLEFRQATAGETPFYHFAFSIPYNKVDAAKTWLEEKKITLLRMEEYNGVIAEFVNWKARSVYFIDPAGNIGELIGREAGPEGRGEPFNASDLLGISEAGLVFEEPVLENACRGLMSQYHLPFFHRQPPLPGFKAIGDDNGLFIAVTSNRNWYPTEIKSAIFPMSVRFSQNGQDYRLEF